ncbi:hypothetical protein NPIL_418931 [Nephila pilipes]|uniref:Uncharacterized protein n=1 Tax=Nephila pilipes TaxID=299642 RepID=A0A8X6ILB4_NEPPI|nr:hypothetical protein NPIL_418931 [Nephila pilipes]
MEAPTLWDVRREIFMTHRSSEIANYSSALGRVRESDAKLTRKEEEKIMSRLPRQTNNWAVYRTADKRIVLPSRWEFQLSLTHFLPARDHALCKLLQTLLKGRKPNKLSPQSNSSSTHLQKHVQALLSRQRSRAHGRLYFCQFY